MKLISKQEPVKPVAPYVWGAKYLVLDSVPKGTYVKAGDTVIATREAKDGGFTVCTEIAFAFVRPQHLQLIDGFPQPEPASETVYTVELTESELQGIYSRIITATYGASRNAAINEGFPSDVSERINGMSEEILNLLKENKQ